MSETQDGIVQLIKNQITTLSYVEKMQLKEWMEKEIDKDRGAYVDEKKKVFEDKFDNLVKKSSEILSNSAGSLSDSFKKAFGGSANTDNTNTPGK